MFEPCRLLFLFSIFVISLTNAKPEHNMTSHSAFGHYPMRRPVEYSSPHPYPFMVSVRLWPNDENVCTGTIIGPSSILTAASCIFGWFEKELRLKVGSNNGDQATIYEIGSYAVHPDFDHKTHVNDIALIHPKQPIKMIPNKVSPVFLAATEPSVGSHSYLLTWSSKRADPHSKDELKRITTTIKDRESCDPDMYDLFTVDSRQLCTLNVPEEGACNSDFGGPLMTDGKQVGIVSYFLTVGYDMECGNGLPIVHTSVVKYRQWIASNLK
ncbi:hypothetical protein BLOT_008021 [Blomia tropicalis]|nr:hypothetical protein BLOT_008021 [Blomia tropicalis]